MAFYCRDEARSGGCTDLLGRSVRDALGGVGSVRQALALSDSRDALNANAYDEDDADLAEAARLLSAARRARREALREADGRGAVA